VILNICPDCFEADGLQRKIISVRKAVSTGPCDMHPSKKGIPIEELAQIIDPVFRDLYWGGPDDGSVWSANRGSVLVDTLYELTGAIDDTILDELIAALCDQDFYRPQKGEEPYYDEDFRYVLQDDHDGTHFANWQNFQRSLMFESRFFNPDAERALNDIFHGMQQLRDANGRGPVYLIEPGTPEAHFFRARVANEYEDFRRIEANLARELGPPPERLRKAGRLNPAGISAFYGAFDLATCIAELRPSVGGKVISAGFKLEREICVLDMTRFVDKPRAVNHFASGARRRARQWVFMETFMEEIARPVSPGTEHLEYLPTQAVAEFLNKRFQLSFAGRRRHIDAVIFKSAQRPEGKNIVLLGDAALVGPAKGSAKAKIARTLEAVEQAHDDFESWFDHAVEESRKVRPASLTPEPETVRWTKISGAQFTPEDLTPGTFHDDEFDQ